MEAIREVTGGQFPPHVYLLEGTTLVAYIKRGETTPFYFKNGIKGFDKRGRKFEKVDAKQFKVKTESTQIEVKGSKGNSYFIDPEAKTCTCPGYTFRGACKHIGEVLKEAA
jgi:uncharacterized Zn finger protein